MNTKNLIIAIAATVLLVGAGIVLRNYSAPPTGQNNAPAQGNAVVIENFSFNPETLSVTPGTAVVWINNDSATHSVKSDTFSSRSLSKGQSFEFTFASKGTYDYSCGIHPSMKGKIIVE